MAELSEKITEITGQENLEELKQKLKENFDMLQRLVDGLTGQRLEDWTPVLRDGSVHMTGDLTIDGAVLKLKDSDGINEISIRRGGDGTLEHKDGVNADWTSVYDPKYEDVTNDRALDTVYRNKNKKRTCQITLKMYTS